MVEWMGVGGTLARLAVRLGRSLESLKRAIAEDDDLSQAVEEEKAHLQATAAEWQDYIDRTTRMAVEKSLFAGNVTTVNLAAKLRGVLDAPMPTAADADNDDLDPLYVARLEHLAMLERMSPRSLAEWYWLAVREGSTDEQRERLAWEPPDSFIGMLDSMQPANDMAKPRPAADDEAG